MLNDMMRVGFVLAAVLLTVTGPTPLAGQESTTPVFLALPEQFPDVDARVLLIREPGRNIVILNPSSPGVDELGTALSLLRRVERERGEPVRGQMIPIVGFNPGPRLDDAERARLEKAIADVRTRPVSNVGTFGLGRWMRLATR